MANETWVKDNGTWREAGEIWIKDSGTWREVQETWVKDSGTWQQVYQSVVAPTSVTVNNANGSRSENNSWWQSNGYVNATASATVTPPDGGGDYSYSWSHVSGTGITLESSSGNQAYFGGFLSPPSDSSDQATETWRCTVSNSEGSVSDTFTVTITGNNEGS